MRTTSSSGTSPCRVQPNAVDTAPSISTPGCGCCAHLRTSSTICSGVMRTFDSLCLRLAETGKVTLCAPASSARWKPFRFGASATTFTSGSVLAKATISPVSAIAGISFGGTNEPTSISFKPGRGERARSRPSSLRSASGGCAFCRPSRGPTSQMWTFYALILFSMAADCDTAERGAGGEREQRPQVRVPAEAAWRSRRARAAPRNWPICEACITMPLPVPMCCGVRACSGRPENTARRNHAGGKGEDEHQGVAQPRRAGRRSACRFRTARRSPRRRRPACRAARRARAASRRSGCPAR